MGKEQSASRELSAAHLLIGAPLTQPLTYLTTEALCWWLLAFAQLHAGQVQHSICSVRTALTLAPESKNDWAQVSSTFSLTFGLVDAGAYEDALVRTHRAVSLSRPSPPEP